MTWPGSLKSAVPKSAYLSCLRAFQTQWSKFKSLCKCSFLGAIPHHKFPGTLAAVKAGWSSLQVPAHCCTSTPQTEAHSHFVQLYSKPDGVTAFKKCFLTKLLCGSELKHGHANGWISPAQRWAATSGEQNGATGGPADSTKWHHNVPHPWGWAGHRPFTPTTAKLG